MQANSVIFKQRDSRKYLLNAKVNSNYGTSWTDIEDIENFKVRLVNIYFEIIIEIFVSNIEFLIFKVLM